MTARTPSRLARNLSAAVVAGIAAWSSYSHMAHVALRYGERPEVAYVLPLSVDGMLVVAATAMLDDKQAGRRVRPAARVAFVAGVVASIAANVAAAHPVVGARIVAAWPALALLMVVEMLSRSGRTRHAPPAATERNPDGAEHAAIPAPLIAAEVPAAQAAVQGHGLAELRTAEPQPVKRSAAEDGEPPPVIPRQGGGTGARRSRQPTAVTRRLARHILATEPDITRAEVAARVGVSPRRLREVLAEDP